jgi:beta-galactosidase
LMTYGTSAGWLAGKPAALEHGYGKGSITYLGATLDPKLLKSFVAATLASNDVSATVPGLPEDVELMQRSSNHGAKIWVLINHGLTVQHITLPVSAVDLFNGSSINAIDLPAHGVVVVSPENPR